MVECRHCRSFFETAPEKIGARCPDCKMPLFERFERPKRSSESGFCVQHPTQTGIASCAECGKRLCLACRTRWHERYLCPGCVDASLAAAQEHPRETKAKRTRAALGLTAALSGVAVAAVGLIVFLLSADRIGGSSAAWGVGLALAALLPAAAALGQSAPTVLHRGAHYRAACVATALSACQIGLTLGLVLVNCVRN